MIVVADNLRITRPFIGRAVEQLDPAPVRELAMRCRDAGAEAIDINSGPLSRKPAERMTFLVETVQAAVDLPLVLDTTNPDAMAAGLTACRRRPVINGLSLEKDKLARILPLATRYDCDLIAYLLRPDGHVPPDAAGRMESAIALFDKCQQAGITPDRLIFDPVVAPLAWQDGNRQNMAVLDVIRSLPDLLGFPVHTIAGLSNLTTGAPGSDLRRRYQSAFLPMLAAAGTTMILMNALDPSLVTAVGDCRRICADTVFTWQ
ncbi:dihydropteroate synthase [Desulfosarcina ovata]|uniref:Methyltetrahydrofolate--corrinoid methyltransferase n=1 Tax=Desulfosarcina ovata subsp. ovata TaxID=2752305 RepID=A0A5K8A760_9BACT|nr:dihydropteroate synthase [Desulfosarcina ovata]BBO88452.1 methyltetrahydrofolate--corrinoid methyltransferase [Desulfosarcina ovata subsp. ovata]